MIIERKISGQVPQIQSGFSGTIQGVEIEVAFARYKPQRIRYSPDGHQTELNEKYGVTQDVEEIRGCVVIWLLMH